MIATCGACDGRGAGGSVRRTRGGGERATYAGRGGACDGRGAGGSVRRTRGGGSVRRTRGGGERATDAGRGGRGGCPVQMTGTVLLGKQWATTAPPPPLSMPLPREPPLCEYEYGLLHSPYHTPPGPMRGTARDMRVCVGKWPGGEPPPPQIVRRSGGGGLGYQRRARTAPAQRTRKWCVKGRAACGIEESSPPPPPEAWGHGSPSSPDRPPLPRPSKVEGRHVRPHTRHRNPGANGHTARHDRCAKGHAPQHKARHAYVHPSAGDLRPLTDPWGTGPWDVHGPRRKTSCVREAVAGQEDQPSAQLWTVRSAHVPGVLRWDGAWGGGGEGPGRPVQHRQRPGTPAVPPQQEHAIGRRAGHCQRRAVLRVPGDTHTHTGPRRMYSGPGSGGRTPPRRPPPPRGCAHPLTGHSHCRPLNTAFEADLRYTNVFLASAPRPPPPDTDACARPVPSGTDQ